MVLSARVRWLIGAVVLTMAAGFLFPHTPPRATWLSVEGSPRAFADTPFEIRVRLREAPAGSVLTVGLHGTVPEGGASRLLLPDQTVEARPDGTEHRFVFRVPGRSGAAWIHAVICLSPTGRWRDRTHAASSEPIALEGAPAPGDPAALRPLRTFRLEPARVHRTEPSRAFRWATAGLLFAGAALAMGLWPRGRLMSAVPAQASIERRVRLALAASLLLTGLWEAFGLGTQIAGSGRDAMRAWGYYRQRAPVQHALTLGLVVGTGFVAAALVRLRVHAGLRLALLCGVVEGLLCLLSALSLHAFDAAGAVKLAGATLLQGVKLANAALALVAVGLAAHRALEDPAGPTRRPGMPDPDGASSSAREDTE